MKGCLGEAYINANRRQDALSFIDAEMKDKPLTVARARVVVDLLRQLGIGQAALDVARLAEFTIADHARANDRASHEAARMLVNGQLRQAGLVKELRDRIETRKASGELLAALDYQWLGDIYPAAEAVTILQEGVEKYPKSVALRSDYVQALYKAGRKNDAWRGYEQARDLYFAKVANGGIPAAPGDVPEDFEALSPALIASPWYLYLLREGKADELQRLESRLLEACAATRTKPEELVFPRAGAEFAAGKYAAATKSLETCLEKKQGNEVVVVGALARSLRALHRPLDAIEQYRRAVQLSEVDSGLLSEFLCLVVEVQGVNGILRELPAYEQTWPRLNVRVNAILSCFSAWAALATGDEKGAFEKLILAGPYNLLASQQLTLGEDEGLICAVILTVLSEHLADSKRFAEGTGFLKRFPPERVLTTDFLKRFPAERVQAMRDVFSVTKRK